VKIKKIGPKIQRVSLNNFVAGGSILTKLLQTCRKAGVITRVQFLDGPPQKIWEGQKKLPNFGAIFDNFPL